MRIMNLFGAVALVTAFSFGAGAASAGNFSFTGTFTQDDQVQSFTFQVTATSTVVIRTWSYAGGTNAAGHVIPRGGFDPYIALFDSSGMLIAQNNDGTGVVAIDPVSGAGFDAYLSAPPFLPLTLVPGTYTVFLTQSDNTANGGTLADGFSEQGNGNFTAMFGCSNGIFCDITTDNRNGNWALDIDNVASATESSDFPFFFLYFFFS